MAVIASTDNPIYRRLMELHTARGIAKHGEFLAGGPKLVGEIVADRPELVTAWIRTPTLPAPPAELPAAKSLVLAPDRFREVNVLGTPGPLLVLKTPGLPTYDPAVDSPPGLTLFVPFGDPDNVGAVLRTAAALGVARAILLREAASPFLPKAVRASAGALLRLPLELGPALEELVPPTGVPLYALHMQGTPISAIRRRARMAIVAGTEGQGVPASLLARATPVAIPLHNGVESLNAATAVAIALWEWTRPTAADHLPKS